ncbi:cytochrome b [Yoonia sp. MH D7]
MEFLCDVGNDAFLVGFAAWYLGLDKHVAPTSPVGQIGSRWISGHVGLYLLMVAVPAIMLIASAGGTRGFSYLRIQIFPARETAIALTKTLEDWHGTMTWTLALLVAGHIAMALVWHHLIKHDDALPRMGG